ncbi:MAG: hypothetical protein FWG14_10555 [Peptococcaceae bacterium]|nr:hypothetical protein [Peptococcaceae bacterium]
MSYFILYFEECSKDKSSHNEVNVYSIDSGITEGRIPIQYNGMNMEASIIASRMDASVFYVFRKPTKMVEAAQQARQKLFDFISSRIDLKVVPYLFVFILPGAWPEKMQISESPVEVPLSMLEEVFKEGPRAGLLKIIDTGSQALRDFINEPFYRKYLLTVEEKMPVKMDMKSRVNNIVLEVENESCAKAGVSPDDLKWLIENCQEETAQYTTKKYVAYTEPDGGPDEIVNDPPGLTFPIGHLIEYLLLLRQPDKLLGYIQSRRIPGEKKYAREIEKIFSDIQMNK